MDLQLRHLRNLCAIADAGSLNRAAIALGLPQPALSRQVRRLEQLLGGPLFERDSCGVRPTPLGANVLDHADTIIRLSDSLGEQLRGHQLRQRSTVRVGWATSVLHEPLLHCLRQLPCGGRLRVVTTDSSRNLAALLRSGEVDLALRDHCDGDEPLTPDGSGPVRSAPVRPGLGGGSGREPYDDLISDVVWAESPVHLALAETHPLATAPVITMADLAEEDWISVYGADGCHEKLRRLCGAYGFTPRISHDIPVGGPRSEVIRHQGSIALAQALRPVGPGVVCRGVADLPLRVRHSVAFRKDSRFAAQVPLLVELLANAYQELAGAAGGMGGGAGGGVSSGVNPGTGPVARRRPVAAGPGAHRPGRPAAPPPRVPAVPPPGVPSVPPRGAELSEAGPPVTGPAPVRSGVDPSAPGPVPAPSGPGTASAPSTSPGPGAASAPSTPEPFAPHGSGARSLADHLSRALGAAFGGPGAPAPAGPGPSVPLGPDAPDSAGRAAASATPGRCVTPPTGARAAHGHTSHGHASHGHTPDGHAAYGPPPHPSCTNR